MKIIDRANCKFCNSYEVQRLKARDSDKIVYTFWCALRMKAYKYKQSTNSKPLFEVCVRESRLHYCPYCGRELITCRRRKKKNGTME